MASKSALFLMTAVIALLCLGVVMLLSTSAFSHEEGGAGIVRHHALALLIGAAGCTVMARLDYHWLQKGTIVWYAGALVLLALCFIPPFGDAGKGAARWVSLQQFGFGWARFQPSEFAKLAVVVFLASWFARHHGDAGSFGRGFVFPLLGVMVPVGLVGAEVDLGAASLITTVALMLMFVAGSGMVYLGMIGAAGLAGLGLVVWRIPERLDRVMAFLELAKYRTGDGYQQWEALRAFGFGGIGGVGLGNGRSKMDNLPEAHNDFILPVVGEELGLRVTLLVVFLFVVILVSGFTIALHARDRFGRLLAFGVTSLIILQAAINIGVTTAVLPNKGLPLPFVSYGGSNLLFCMAGVGILISVFRQGVHFRDDRFPKILHAKVTARL